MKDKIHPETKECAITCGCGATFSTISIKDKLHVEVCSKCHPFYTGTQRMLDSAGRVDKFQKKYNWGKKEKA